MNATKPAALWCILLIALLPAAVAAQIGNGILDVTLAAPDVVSDIAITVTGTAPAGAQVELLINGEVRRVISAVGPAGEFTFLNVALPAETNALVARATLNNAVGSAERQVRVDRTPPRLDIAIPPFFADIPTLNGSVDKPVTLRHRVIAGGDTAPPLAPRGLAAGTVAQNAVTFSWQPVAEESLRGYLVYRDGNLIAALSTPVQRNGTLEFIDQAAAAETSYDYSVSAVDAGCNEGPAAGPLRITTGPGDSRAATPLPPSLDAIGCGFQEQQVPAGTFTLPLQLQEGVPNTVEIIAIDSAGHRAIVRGTTTLDTQPPQFLTHNLDTLSPSYAPRITIQGALSEPGTVFIYINGEKKPAEFARTGAGNTFSLDVTLRRDVSSSGNISKASIDTGVGWDNAIKLEAVDLAGRKAELPSTIVRYALCGFGTTFRVELGQITPTSLNPRLLLQNIQQAGIPFNITYRGNAQQVFINPNQIRVRPLLLSGDVAEEYDNDWVEATALVDKRGNTTYVGYIQVDFSHVPDPQLGKANATLFDKEANISANHKGECGQIEQTPVASSGQMTPGAPGLGCVKLFLELEIPYQEIFAPGRTLDPRTALASNQLLPQPKNAVQRVCMPISIVIDQRIPPDLLPQSFLRKSVEFLDSAIEVIDDIVKPLTTIGTYLLYGCLGGNIWLYVNYFQERLNCEGQQILSVFTGGFDKRIAEAGLCEDAFAGDDQRQAACMRCQSTIAARKSFESGVLHQVCDRVACPSAPSLQTYVRDQGGSVEPIAINADTLANSEIAKWAYQGSLWAGSDCGFYGKYRGPQKTIIPEGPLKINFNGIDDIYRKYTGEKPMAGGLTKEDCQKTLRPAHPDCCGFDYMTQWGTACGLSSSSEDLFDEIKESACLAAQKAGVPERGPQCNVLWNSVAGFCEPGSGRELPEIIGPFPGIQFQEKPVEAAKQDIYVRLTPVHAGSEEDVSDYAVEFGMVYEQFRLSQEERSNQNIFGGARGASAAAGERFQPGETSMVNAQLYFTPVDGADIHSITAELPTDQKANLFCEDKAFAAKVKEWCRSDLAGKLKDPAACDKQAENIWRSVCSKVGIADKEYIVIPESGFLRSVQCACVPAVTSYLQLWRNIMVAGRNCLQKILITGDGSSGVCQAALSQYACDLIYELVRCFTQKYGASGGGKRVSSGPFGDVIGALTGAGSDVSRSVSSRYGNTALYKTMFIDRKLMHAVCAFAFTGEWNLDVQGIFQQTVDSIPIESQGLLFPCERRFISYNPLTQPSGLTTWNYHFGTFLAAGADLRYELRLQCSNGFRCNPADGYRGGECDCNTKKREDIFVSSPDLGTGQLRKNDILNAEVFQTVQADVRYDKAVLKWEYDDKKTGKIIAGQSECGIKLVGGDAPAFCSFDPFTLTYRCQFGTAISGLSLKSVRPHYPELKHPATGQQLFPLKEPLNFQIDIKQTLPDRPKGDDEKCLGYRIYDGAGDLFDANTPEDNAQYQCTEGILSLRTSGDYTRDISVPVDESKMRTAIAKGTRTTRPQDASAWRGSPRLSRPVADAETITGVTVTDTSTGQTVDRMYLIEFPSQNSLEYSLYRAPQSAGVYTQQNGFPKGEAVQGAASTLTPEQAGGASVTFFDEIQTAQQGVTQRYQIVIQFGKIPTFLDGETRLQFHLSGRRQAPQQPVSAQNACEKGDVVPWRIEVYAYDADKFGTATTQRTTDAITGRPAQVQSTFLVSCLEKDKLKGLGETLTQPAAPAPAQQPLPGSAGAQASITFQGGPSVAQAQSGGAIAYDYVLLSKDSFQRLQLCAKGTGQETCTGVNFDQTTSALPGGGNGFKASTAGSFTTQQLNMNAAGDYAVYLRAAVAISGVGEASQKGPDKTIKVTASTPTGGAIAQFPCPGACSKIGCIAGSVPTDDWCPPERQCCVFP